MSTGQPIKCLHWEGTGESLSARRKGELIYSEQNLGGYGLAWCVQLDENNDEIARHNLAYVTTVVWWRD